jgi:uncharacterized protein (DUF1684 family)
VCVFLLAPWPVPTRAPEPLLVDRATPVNAVALGQQLRRVDMCSGRIVGLRAWGSGLALAGALLVAACGSDPVDPDVRYAQTLLAARAAKDDAFRRQSNQPIPPARIGELLPLRYFAPDPEYAVPASFKPSAARTLVPMPTSTGKIRDMEVVGLLEFTLKGRKLALGAFVEAGEAMDRLFVPFTDLTTGTETYAAGRYIEIDRSPSGVYVVDFNRAFHPFCYYNADYDCPYPPPQNRLPIPIRAGEKLPEPVGSVSPRR